MTNITAVITAPCSHSLRLFAFHHISSSSSNRADVNAERDGSFGSLQAEAFTSLTALTEDPAVHTSNCLCLKNDSFFCRLKCHLTKFCTSLWCCPVKQAWRRRSECVCVRVRVCVCGNSHMGNTCWLIWRSVGRINSICLQWWCAFLYHFSIYIACAEIIACFVQLRVIEQMMISNGSEKGAL